MSDDLTPDEQAELARILGGGSAPVPDEKHNIHTFISKVLTTKDTTKVGNLTDIEIGMMKNPVRSYKEAAAWALNIIKCEGAAKMLDNYSEIATSTSLSRKGTLLRVATTTTKHMADLTPQMRENKGWFKPKTPAQETGAI